MKILVLGGRGFLGSYVTKALAHHTVITGDMRSGGKKHRQVDITNPNDVRKAVTGVDLVINLVGLSPLKQGPFQQVHVNGVLNILATKKPLIQISALGADSKSEIEYLKTKGVAEELVQNSGIAHAIIRPSVLFGTGAELFSQLDRIPIFPRLPTKVQPVYAGDVAKVIASLVQKPNGIHELAGPTEMTMYEFAAQYRKILPVPFVIFKPFFWIACTLQVARLSKNQYKSLFLNNTAAQHPAMITTYSDWIKKERKKIIER